MPLLYRRLNLYFIRNCFQRYNCHKIVAVFGFLKLNVIEAGYVWIGVCNVSDLPR